MKITFLPFMMIAAGLLTGCQTGTYMSSAATDGDGVTCAEIYQAFEAYDRDRQSAAAWQQLSGLISPEAGALAAKGADKAAQYYESTKASVNLALAVRGCQPVQ